jgi:hypothetical protein
MTDYVPRLDQDVAYRAVASAANGAYSVTDAPVATPSTGACALNFGDGEAQILILQWDAAVGRDREDDSETFTFAGRKDPVTYAGEHTKETIGLSATLADAANQAALEALGEWHQACTYRQPGGKRKHVKVTKLSDNLTGSLAGNPTAIELLVVE